MRRIYEPVHPLGDMAAGTLAVTIQPDPVFA
jgi:hypothetical protein